MSVDPVNENWFQFCPAGQAALYLISQYWMNARPVDPLFSNTNCCQPWHDGFGEPVQPVLMKFVFSWSVYALATAAPVLPIGPLSLVTPVTLSNEPIAVEMWLPLGT